MEEKPGGRGLVFYLPGGARWRMASLPEARRLVLKPRQEIHMPRDYLRFFYRPLAGRKFAKNQRIKVGLFGRTLFFKVDAVEPNPAVLGPKTRFGVWAREMKVDDAVADLIRDNLSGKKTTWEMGRKQNKKAYKIKKKKERIKKIIKWPRDWEKKAEKKRFYVTGGWYNTERWLEQQLKELKKKPRRLRARRGRRQNGRSRRLTGKRASSS